MIHKSSIDEKTAKHIDDVLAQPPEPAKEDAKAVISFYKKNYKRVQTVRCNKCKELLCLEILDPEKYTAMLAYHHEGLRRIELLGSPLLSSRRRLDGVMGYQCLCGNDTRNSKVELGIVPSVPVATNPAMIPVLEPHHAAMVRLEMAKQHYTPDVEEMGNKTRVETFTVERIV